MQRDLDAVRLGKVQEIAEKLLNVLELRLTSADSGEWTPQAYKHISGTLKDIKELLMLRSEAEVKEQQLKLRQLERQVMAAEEMAGQLTVQILPDGQLGE